MKSLYRYSVLAVLGFVIIALLASTFSGPVIYSLKTNLFPSVFHENTDVLKVEAFNSTLNLLPLMQDLLDYTGPIVLNINIRDMDQARYYLDLLSKSNIKLKNLVINLEMTDSEIEEFSKNKELQQKLLQELMDSTISLDELDSLMIRYRNDKNMLVTIELQREALLKRLHEIRNEYRAASEKIQTISEKIGLDETQEKESVKELEQMVKTEDEMFKEEEKVPQGEILVPRIPTLSLLVNPDTGKYGDRIGLSGVYRSSTGSNGSYPVSIHVENGDPVSTSTEVDGIYKTGFVIEKISPGNHTLHAASGLTTSENRTLTVIPVGSTTSLDIQPVYNLDIQLVYNLDIQPVNNLDNQPVYNLDLKSVFNKPVIVCYGTVRTGEFAVRNAPVDLISDYHTILRQTSDNYGSYQAQIVLSPGMHQIQAQFVNASYPLFSSKSQAYLVEAGRDSILSIRLLDLNMSADELSLVVDPATASYKDVINITGVLSGKDPKDKSIDVFIDGTLSHRLKTRPDGSYLEKYNIEKMKTGTHLIFSRYSEPDIGEIYSEPRPITITAADSATSLDIEITDGGTSLIYTGNVTARGQGVPSAPVELVVDNRSSQNVETDATGTFRQKMRLPAGNHSIFTRFTDDQYPVNPSQSRIHHFTILPPIDLSIHPLTVKYRDTLTFSGSLRGDLKPGQDVQIYIDEKKMGSAGSDGNGNYSVQIPVEKIPGGTHTAYARSGEYSTDRKTFAVTMVNSTTTLVARLDNASSEISCSGQVMADDTIPVRSAPVTLIWDGDNRVITTTDEGGRYETMLSLPAGNHTLSAQFNAQETYPIQPSVSGPIMLQIRNPVVVQVQPDHGAYRDVLTISGEIQGLKGTDRDLELVIDGKKAGSLRSDSSGTFMTHYLIERIPGGPHTLMVGAGDLMSEPIEFTVVIVDSTTTLVAGRIGDSSEVSCTGLVMAHDQPVRSAPVYLIWDDTHTVETMTDAAGAYTEILTLPAGQHTIRAQFNSTAYPIRASESAIVRIDIPVKMPPQGTLALEIMPEEGRYQDHLTIRGNLSYDQTGQILSGKTVKVFIDGISQGRYTTDANGKFTGEFIVNKIRGGSHILYGMTGEIESEPVRFTVVMVDSTTTLVAGRIGDSSEVSCTGLVMTHDQPVRSAPVYLIWDDTHTVDTTTDAAGAYTEILTLPAGQHTIRAQFNSTAYPIRASESAIVRVDIPVKMPPQGTLALEIMPGEGRYQDHLTIRGNLSYDPTGQILSGKTVNVFIDGISQGRYTTDANGKFTGEFIVNKIRGGSHILYGMTGEIESEPVRFTVVVVDSTTTLVAGRIGDSSEVSCAGLVMTHDQPVRSAPVYLIWDDTHTVETVTDTAGAYTEILTLPAGQHTIRAQFNSTAYPIRASESAIVRVDIPVKIQHGTLLQGTLLLEIMPEEGRYQDHLTIRGNLSYDHPGQEISGKTVDVFMDGISQGRYTTDANGKFTGEFIIDKIRGGSHILYGMTGEIESEPVRFTVVMVDSTTRLSVRNIGETSRVECSGTVIANNKPVRSAPVLLIWDDATSIRTSTDENGYYQETLALPAGMHHIQARFNASDELPIYSSESAPVNVEIAPSLTVSIQPDRGNYRDELVIHGELHTETIARQEIQLFIDNASYRHYYTDDTGRFTTPYVIENISAGLHAVRLRSGEYQSGILPFTVLPVNSATTLSAQRTGTTSLIECSGTVFSGDKPVRFAPVTIIWDNNSLETFTDEKGVFKDTIILPAGKHRIQAFFNSSPLFPVHPSASTPVIIDIAPGLSLSVRPASGIYHDTLRFEGTLIQSESVGASSVDIFIDDNLAATGKTGPGGLYSSTMTIERISAGQHRAIARSGNWSSDTVTFQVLPVRSQTTLAITAVNQSALYECTGRVTAFDRPVTVQKPLTVHDAETILKSFWKNSRNPANRPVISAPVAIVSNTTILLETTTDNEGRFSELMSLSEGQNVIVAQFVNDSYPIFSSQSPKTVVDIPSANLTLTEENGQSTVRILGPLAAVAILLLFTVGAGYYLKRNSLLFKEKQEPLESMTQPELLPDGDRSEVPESLGETQFPDTFPHTDQILKDPIFARYLRILHAEGLSTAARTVYVYFTGTIAQTLHIRSHKALTPREFLQTCEKKPFMAPVSSFIALYEQIRYGGARSLEKQGEFEESIRTTDESLEGEHH